MTLLGFEIALGRRETRVARYRSADYPLRGGCIGRRSGTSNHGLALSHAAPTRNGLDQGIKQNFELKKRVRAWWREDALGAVALTVRYGAKAIEFEKGKSAIAVPSKDELTATIDTVIAAIKAGELDEHLAQQAKARGIPKSKRAT